MAVSHGAFAVHLSVDYWEWVSHFGVFQHSLSLSISIIFLSLCFISSQAVARIKCTLYTPLYKTLLKLNKPSSKSILNCSYTSKLNCKKVPRMHQKSPIWNARSKNFLGRALRPGPLPFANPGSATAATTSSNITQVASLHDNMYRLYTECKSCQTVHIIFCIITDYIN